MAFFSRFPAGEFTPFFRLLDEYDAHRSACRKTPYTPVRSFAPKFDVRESRDGYHLDGELPGIDQKNIEIEFTDPHTLVIKGHVKREYANTNFNDSQNQTEAADDDASSIKSHQPTVEDEDEATNTSAVTVPSKLAEIEVNKSKSEPVYKYWASERSIGEFHRTFSFPTRIDQDAVKASLSNGILSIMVPKAQALKIKKIRVE